MNEECGPYYSDEPSMGSPKSLRGRCERPTISHQRRVELSQLAIELSNHMINKVKPHEMRLLWNMIDNLTTSE